MIISVFGTLVYFRVPDGLVSKTFNRLVPHIASRTGYQLMLLDGTSDTAPTNRDKHYQPLSSSVLPNTPMLAAESGGDANGTSKQQQHHFNQQQQQQLQSLPLLCAMAHPDSTFHSALSLFQRLVSAANIDRDRSVPYTTAAMTLDCPFTPGGHGVVSVDPAYPAIVRQAQPGTEEEQGSKQLPTQQ